MVKKSIKTPNNKQQMGHIKDGSNLQNNSIDTGNGYSFSNSGSNFPNSRRVYPKGGKIGSNLNLPATGLGGIAVSKTNNIRSKYNQKLGSINDSVDKKFDQAEKWTNTSPLLNTPDYTHPPGSRNQYTDEEDDKSGKSRLKKKVKKKIKKKLLKPVKKLAKKTAKKSAKFLLKRTLQAIMWAMRMMWAVISAIAAILSVISWPVLVVIFVVIIVIVIVIMPWVIAAGPVINFFDSWITTPQEKAREDARFCKAGGIGEEEGTIFGRAVFSMYRQDISNGVYRGSDKLQPIKWLLEYIGHEAQKTPGLSQDEINKLRIITYKIRTDYVGEEVESFLSNSSFSEYEEGKDSPLYSIYSFEDDIKAVNENIDTSLLTRKALETFKPDWKKKKKKKKRSKYRTVRVDRSTLITNTKQYSSNIIEGDIFTVGKVVIETNNFLDVAPHKRDDRKTGISFLVEQININDTVCGISANTLTNICTVAEENIKINSGYCKKYKKLKYILTLSSQNDFRWHEGGEDEVGRVADPATYQFSDAEASQYYNGNSPISSMAKIPEQYSFDLGDNGRVLDYIIAIHYEANNKSFNDDNCLLKAELLTESCAFNASIFWDVRIVDQLWRIQRDIYSYYNGRQTSLSSTTEGYISEYLNARNGKSIESLKEDLKEDLENANENENENEDSDDSSIQENAENIEYNPEAISLDLIIPLEKISFVIQTFQNFQKCKKGEGYDKECPKLSFPTKNACIYGGYYSYKYPYKSNKWYGTHRYHGAYDIHVKGGTTNGAVLNPIAPGKVIFSGWAGASAYGNAIEILHEGGYSSYYGHMLKASPVKKGSVVDVSTVIGQIGSTGNSSGPHLHLEVRSNPYKVPSRLEANNSNYFPSAMKDCRNPHKIQK